ncbi:hypothetical protein ASPWEDRAFT_46850, partial [Aspergillus wentii DTO 134E9]
MNQPILYCYPNWWLSYQHIARHIETFNFASNLAISSHYMPKANALIGAVIILKQRDDTLRLHCYLQITNGAPIQDIVALTGNRFIPRKYRCLSGTLFILVQCKLPVNILLGARLVMLSESIGSLHGEDAGKGDTGVNLHPGHGTGLYPMQLLGRISFIHL